MLMCKTPVIWHRSHLVVMCVVLLLLIKLGFLPVSVFAAQTIDMGDSNNWNIRFDGPTGSQVSNGTIQTADIYQTGNQDIVIAAPCTSYNSNANSGSIYIIAHSLYREITGKGRVVDLANSSNFTLRIDGPTSGTCPTTSLGSLGTLKLQDLNDDSKPDLTVSASATDYNSRTDSGSIYVLYNELIQQNTTNETGNIMYLAHTDAGGNFDHFNLRFDGPQTNSPVQGVTLTTSSMILARYIGIARLDGQHPDLIVSATLTGFNNYLAGSNYIISNSLISTWSGVGNTIDLNSNSNYSLRIDMAHAYFSAPGYYSSEAIGDLNGNGKDDLVIGVRNIDNNKRNPNYIGGAFVLYDSTLIPYLASTGNVIDLGDSSNPQYDILLQTGEEGSVFAYSGAINITDLNKDGKGWLAVGARLADTNGLTNNGSVYLIPYSLLSSYTGKGNNINLTTTPTSYYLRIDGADNENWLSDMFTTFQDYFGLGKNDMLTGGPKQPSTSTGANGPDDLGQIYVIPNSLINNQQNSSGNMLDLRNTSNYSLLYQGARRSADATKGSHLVAPMSDVPIDTDLNGDGTHDLLLSAHYADFVNGTNSGSLYIIYNFPHTVTISSTRKSGNLVTIKGNVAAPNSVTTIANVQYKLSDNAPTNNWNNCSADDGTFNSLSESYTCVISNVPETTGDHTIFIRAVDANGSHTYKSHYPFSLYTIANNQSSGTYQIPFMSQPNAPGRFVTATNSMGSYISGITTLIEPETFSFNAFLWSEIVIPDKRGVLPHSLSGTTNLVTNSSIISFAEGQKIGFMSGKVACSQISNIYNVWYKAYDANGGTSNAPHIIPGLQSKPSIISLSYEESDLALSGQTPFSPRSLAIAHSIDGFTWQVLPNSAVDTANHTVAAIDTIGGYYMIVARANGRTVIATKTPLHTSSVIDTMISSIPGTPQAPAKPESLFKQLIDWVLSLFRANR